MAINWIQPPTVSWPHDTRIKAIVIAAPALTLTFGPGDLKNVTMPVQLWRGTDDQNVPDEWNTALVRHELPRSPEEHVIPHAGHFIFMAPCSFKFAKEQPAICVDPPGVDRIGFHREFDSAVAAFFRKSLGE